VGVETDYGTGVETRPMRPEDEPAVVEVLLAAFGEWPHDVPEASAHEFFRWKHVEGPWGPSIGIVAEVDGAVAGFCGQMPWRMRGGGELWHAMRGVDLAVRPAHRGRGVARRLREPLMLPAEVAFRWSNPNDLSHRGNLNTGSQNVGRIRAYVRPCRGGSTLGRGIGSGDRHRELEVHAPTAAEVLADADLVQRALAGAGSDQPLTTARDAGYLRWRYGRFGKYRAIAAADGSAGVAIFRVRRQGRLAVADVCELLVEGPDRHTETQLLRRISKSCRVAALIVNARSTAAAAARGLLPSRHGVSITATPVPDGPAARPDPTRLRSWALSRGDLELI
jgi:GNAT superfamily N-acetyltransferase